MGSLDVPSLDEMLSRLEKKDQTNWFVAVMTCLLVVPAVAVLVGAILIYFAMTNAFVFFKFWEWFIIPINGSLPVLSYLQCIGVMFTVGCLKTPRIDNKKSEDIDQRKNIGGIFGMLCVPWIALSIGYIFKICFIG